MGRPKTTKKLKEQSAERDKNKFLELIKSTPIYDNINNNIYTPHADEVFEQCYDTTKARRYFPTNWFISNYGNLISIRKNRLVMLHKLKNGSGYFYCEYYHYEKKKNKTKAFIHILVALVHHADCYGLAKDLIKSKGLDAIGRDSKSRLTVQCHHKDGNIYNNHVSNLKLITVDVHQLLNSTDKIKDNSKFMEKMITVVEEQQQEQVSPVFTIVTTGQAYNDKGERVPSNKDIKDVKGLTFSPNGYREFINCYRELVKKSKE